MTSSYPVWTDILKASEQLFCDARALHAEAHHLAEQRRAEAAEKGDKATARLWRDVWVHLMSRKYLQLSQDKSNAA
ncbi:MAG TPA: hypothetical protein VL625_10810 [Patescibacteria group bacterium]|jgi:hypothetical protein|nr:hypothetical protein [Patescibacteria group bacterium]